MSLLKINGVDMPTPSSMSLGIQDIVKAERNARGTMIIEKIATKRKIDLQWAFLTPAQLSSLLTAVSSSFFSVTYTDIQTNSTRTGTFYAGDKNAGVMDYINGVLRYKDVKFNVIER